MNLKTPIRELGNNFKLYARRLKKLGINTVLDFLYHLPSRYEDYSLISKIGNLQAGETVTIQGRVLAIKNEYTKNWKKLQKAKVSDETGIIDIIWFNQPFLVKYIQRGDFVSLAGKVDLFSNKLVLVSPQYEVLSDDANKSEIIHTGRLIPIYPETRGVSSKWLRRQIHQILNKNKQNLLEHLPYSIIKNNGLLELPEAIEQIHFPNSIDNAELAKYRLAFDELFLLQMSAIKRKADWKNNLIGSSFPVDKFKEKIEEFWQKLPFELTNAQKRTVKEIFSDIAKRQPMNRLLEGDVGSGKTVVATIAMYLSYLNGYQSVLMAPTEILANQHYNTISNLLNPFGVKVNLLTGSRKWKMENGKWKILVGTHALLYKNENFKNVGLVIIDEQQRFGVEQRALIRQKGKNPHFLTMTATPIPRTIALTMYGDLDLSILDEMPIGRKPVKTWLVPSQKRNKAYEWIKKQIRETKSQAFVICPFIEPSESLQTVKAAVEEYKYLKTSVFPNFKLGLLHGKLTSKDKNSVLAQFRDKKLDILVATPVVEVGIDIPDATIMVIEGADRFGLSELHQLRGRVGRGDKQSYCLLFTEAKSERAKQRLKALETKAGGAELAELDLKLRGPGEIYGTMQHGIPLLKIASFSDFALIEKTKKEAMRIFPKLPQYPNLREKLNEVATKQVSPD